MKTIDLMEKMEPAVRNGGFRMEGYWVWCSSVIKGEDGKYHMFASRWDNSNPMHPTWLTNSEIVRAVSDTPEGPYAFQEVILENRGAKYWDGRSTHNPVITKFKDTYYLYYIGTTHPFLDVEKGEQLKFGDPRVVVARTNKRIGVATSKSILGPWKRFDKPILEPRVNHFDNLFVSNPSPCVDEHGNVIMIYKSRPYLDTPINGFLHGKMQLGIAKGDVKKLEFEQISERPLFEEEEFVLEDPFIWKAEEGYHMIAKDMFGDICGEEHGGAYAYSKNGVDWEIQKQVQSYSRTIKWDDGKTEVMGSLERPFILFEDGKATHMFFATADGPGGFEKATTTWNMVIPLKA